MAYDPSDPRSSLAGSAQSTAGVPRPAQSFDLGVTGSATRWIRSQAVVIAYAQLMAGDEFRVTTTAESALLIPNSMKLSGSSGDTPIEVEQPALLFLPAGDIIVRAHTDGIVVGVYAAALEPALAARCENADEYAVADPNVAPFVSWPAGDGSVHQYNFADVAPEPGRFGRIYRCSTLMVNVLERDPGARNPRKLSPHHHDDFEQISLQLEGDYVHHLRVPWTPDSTEWRDDQHLHCASPAVVVIPPLLIHTSQGVSETEHWLIDIFAPPRVDFSSRQGWVLNAADYPSDSSARRQDRV
jgi:hypothetical protein